MKKRAIAMALACLMACALVALAGCSAEKETYVPAGKSPVVASPVIGQDGLLRVGVNAGNSPLAGVADGRIVGIDPDIAAALADHLGLKVSVVDVGTDPETALVEGTVDIVLGVDKSNSTAALWKSEVYLPTSVALFSLSADAVVPTIGSDATFAAQVSSKSAWSVMNEFGEETLTSTNDLTSALAALADGTVQYVAADAIIGTYAAHGRDLDAHVVALMQAASGYSIAVLDTNTELKAAVSDAVAALADGGIVNVIQTKWLGAPLNLDDVPLTAGAVAMQGFGKATNEADDEAETSEE